MVDRQSVNFLVEKEIQDITADDKEPFNSEIEAYGVIAKELSYLSDCFNSLQEGKAECWQSIVMEENIEEILGSMSMMSSMARDLIISAIHISAFAEKYIKEASSLASDGSKFKLLFSVEEFNK
jgi:hypothetical protein